MKSLPYQKLKDETKITNGEKTRNSNLENKRIETVLIKINSSSLKFQTQIFTIFYFIDILMGIHSYTITYMFLSPTFFIKSSENSGKSLDN